MRSPRIIFDEAVALSVKMPSVRYVDPHSQKEHLVQPQGTRLREDHRYYTDHMKNGVFCLHCTQPVELKGMETSAVRGSSMPNQTPHFALPRGKRHDDGCSYKSTPKPGRKRSAIEIDDSKGLLIEIDTQEYSGIYTKEEGVYSRNGAIVKWNIPDLKDRRREIVTKTADFVALFEKYDADRILNGVVVFNNEHIPMENFLFRYDRKSNKHSSFIQLAERLLRMGKNGQIPCIIEFEIRQERTIDEYSEKRIVTSRPIPYRRAEDGMNEDIIPGAIIDYTASAHDTGVSGAFSFGKKYLVMGMVRLKKDFSEASPYYLNVLVHDADQVVSANIENTVLQRQIRLLQQKQAEQNPSATPA